MHDQQYSHWVSDNQIKMWSSACYAISLNYIFCKIEFLKGAKIMDFILEKTENQLLLSDPGSYDYITCLRERIEYSLFLCLGFLWKNLDGISQEKRTQIFCDLDNMSIGSVVSAIRELDRNHGEILVNRKCGRLFDDYPTIRNSKIGHGYSMADSVASALTPLYNQLIDDIPFLKEKCDVILVKKYDTQLSVYTGIRFPSNKNGCGVRWSCPAEVLGNIEMNFPRTYLMYKDNYYKISPFIYIEERTNAPFVFSSLVEKIVGKTKLCPLFPDYKEDSNIELVFSELVFLSKSDGYRQFSQSNGTIMNNFKRNYTEYIDVGFEGLVRNFLYKNRAYVTATIWGHGGVGKTACIQKICYNLFNDSIRKFSYIVFITAKDRTYNTKTGKVVSQTGNTRFYSEIIETVIKTVYDCDDNLSMDANKLAEYEHKISECKDNILIVIDDYETFEDCEKEKISLFLNSLNAQYHKAIITTRNKRFVIGESIPSNELDMNLTKRFIQEVIRNEYSDHLNSIQLLLADEMFLQGIHDATSGRPIFIYQFIHIYVQKGYQENLIKGIRTSNDAQDFLYGKIVKYLSKNAQYLFATISVISDDDLRFNFEVLEHILSKFITEKEQFEAGLDEILNQKIIERTNDVYGRIYSPELLRIMTEEYSKYPQDVRHTIKNLLDGIGGKNIKCSILEAMLEQADKSRAFGNEQETIEKYRRVLNTRSCPIGIQKGAIKHVADFLSNSRLNPIAAIDILEEYLPLFPDDVEIYILYIYMLWSQGKPEKEKAVNTIWSFFSAENHKKTSSEYLIFFALGTGYCIDFDLQYRHYATEKLRRSQYVRTFNEYGKELFDYISRTGYLKGRASLFHNIRVALIQTIKLCCAMKNYENATSKIKYGLSICAWMRNSGIKGFFVSQVNKWEIELNRIVANQVVEKSNMISDELFSPEIPDLDTDGEDADGFLSKSGRYIIGDVVDVKITRIMDYGAFADIDDFAHGLIHISAIDDRYIENIYNEFAIGEQCRAQIISIDDLGHRIDLSTVGLR